MSRASHEPCTHHRIPLSVSSVWIVGHIGNEEQLIARAYGATAHVVGLATLYCENAESGADRRTQRIGWTMTASLSRRTAHWQTTQQRKHDSAHCCGECFKGSP